MAITTQYDVRLRYMMEDRASRQMRALERNARGAATGLGRVTSGLVALGAGAFGLQKAGSALIGFNATVQDTKLQIAGMLALARKTDLNVELKTADDLFARLQARAKSLPGTTAEYAKMAGMITQPIIDAGLSMKDLEDLTVNSVVAAKALGVAADVAARDIDQALRGQFHSVDVFTGKILGSAGFKGEDGRAKFNAMSTSGRAETLRAALMQKQLTQLAAAQGQTFNGIFSTFRDNLEMTLGKVGMPLFRAITKELQGWNTWLDQNQAKVNEWAEKFGRGLVEGFRYVKDAVGFLVDHAGLLISIGKVWLAVKAANMVGGLISRAGGGLADMMAMMRTPVGLTARSSSPLYGPRRLGEEAMGSAGGRAGMLGSAASLVGALAAGYEFGSWLEETTGIGKGLGRALSDLTGNTSATARKLESLQASMTAFDRDVAGGVAGARARKNAGVMGMDAVGAIEGFRNNLAAQAAAIRAVEAGYLNEASPIEIAGLIRNAVAAGVDTSEVGIANYREVLAKLDQQINGFNAQLAAMPTEMATATALGSATMTQAQLEALDWDKAQANLLKLVLERMNQGLPVDMLSAGAAMMAAVDQEALRRAGGPTATKPKVNVTIQHLEVQSDDPDRFAFGFVEALRDVVKNPSGALNALREG